MAGSRSADPPPGWERFVAPTKEEAIALALSDAVDGDEVAIHAGTCKVDQGEPCSCTPEVIVVRRGKA